MNHRMDEDQRMETCKDILNSQHKEKFRLHHKNNFLRPSFGQNMKIFKNLQKKIGIDA